VIAVAVVLDDPKGNYYGAKVSAPVFAAVAQQVLEYLGVPHDEPITHLRADAKADHSYDEDNGDHPGDVNALYNALNDLPEDDPLRNHQPEPEVQASVAKPAASAAESKASVTKSETLAKSASTSRTVVIDEAKKLQVPALIGLPVRKVIEKASAAGFEVHVTGSGTAREQLPAAGTMVAPNTRIVVRCSR